MAIKVLFDGQVVITRLEPVNLDEFPDLKVIGSPTTGLDHLDLEECKRRGIKVISLQDAPLFTKYITSTAEHTIGLMIALFRNYKTALNKPHREREFYKGHRIDGKSLGIIGYGRVGKQVEKIALGLGMEVRAYDKFQSLYKLEDVLKSDVVSLHINLPGSEAFFTKEMFSQMKPTAYLINTSRDGVIERGSLIWALENKVIAGAAIDFIDDYDLLDYASYHDNLILTSHLGGCTHEDMEATENHITQKVELYINELKESK